MGLNIESGIGNGELAGVVDNRLEVTSRSNPRAFYMSRDNGTVFSWSYTYDPAAGDTILLVSNSDTQKSLYIHSVQLASDTSVQYAIHSPAYPTLAGTLVTGFNINRQSGKIALAEAYGNETGNSIVAANVIWRGFVLANSSNVWVSDGVLQLGYHNIVAVDLVGATNPTACCATIIGWYE